MRLVHLSDIHFGAEVPKLVQAVVENVHRIDPDLVVISGDFTMAGRRREFARAVRFVRSLDVPVLATPGNHDVPVYQLPERFAAPFARYKRSVGRVCERTFLSDEAVLLSLNSARAWDLSLNWSHGHLSDRQVRQADDFFAGAQHARFRALVVHHPFFVPEDLPGFRVIGNGDAMLKVLARHRVHAVLSGHLHRQSLISREMPLETDAGSHTVLLMQVASATTTRRRQQPNAFNLLEVTREGVFVTEHVEHDGAFRAARPHRAIAFHQARAEPQPA